MNRKGIQFEEIIINSKLIVYAINIKEINESLEGYIDNQLINICLGKRRTELQTVKIRFLEYLEAKKDSNLLTGSTSEFFVHLFLSLIAFKQEFLYFNLEENSIKKGFDGYYTKNQEEWILESKSTLQKDIKHKSLVNKAYNGLKDKIEGIDHDNNPWEEAYNHASHKNVNASNSLIDKLGELSDLYTNKTYGQISDYNIMTASTIFLEEDWEEIEVSHLKKIMEKNFCNKKFNKNIVICLNKKSLNHLKEYLRK